MTGITFMKFSLVRCLKLTQSLINTFYNVLVAMISSFTPGASGSGPAAGRYSTTEQVNSSSIQPWARGGAVNRDGAGLK